MRLVGDVDGRDDVVCPRHHIEITDSDNRGKISLVPVQEESAAAAPAVDPTPADVATEVSAS